MNNYNEPNIDKSQSGGSSQVASDEGMNKKSKPGNQWQEPEKQSGQRIFTQPDNPPKRQGESEDDSIADEKKPTRQMTGGPDKPTA